MGYREGIGGDMCTKLIIEEDKLKTKPPSGKRRWIESMAYGEGMGGEKVQLCRFEGKGVSGKEI